MKKIFTLSIWGCGPGKPFDNGYVLLNTSFQDNTIVFSFTGDEQCTIVNPVNITVNTMDTGTVFRIEKASKIVWRHYYYGKPKSDSTLITIQYELTENDQIRIVENGPFEKTQIIPMKNRIAFDSFIVTHM